MPINMPLLSMSALLMYLLMPRHMRRWLRRHATKPKRLHNKPRLLLHQHNLLILYLHNLLIPYRHNLLILHRHNLLIRYRHRKVRVLLMFQNLLLHQCLLVPKEKKRIVVIGGLTQDVSLCLHWLISAQVWLIISYVSELLKRSLMSVFGTLIIWI